MPLEKIDLKRSTWKRSTQKDRLEKRVVTVLWWMVKCTSLWSRSQIICYIIHISFKLIEIRGNTAGIVRSRFKKSRTKHQRSCGPQERLLRRSQQPLSIGTLADQPAVWLRQTKTSSVQKQTFRLKKVLNKTTSVFGGKRWFAYNIIPYNALECIADIWLSWAVVVSLGLLRFCKRLRTCYSTKILIAAKSLSRSLGPL